MKIINEKPPIWDMVVRAGMNPSEQTTVFAYGDAIYNPGGRTLPDDLVAHEETHCKQQKGKPDEWWVRYIQDPLFRIDQEASAYAVQYKFICEREKDRNRRFVFLHQIATQLSGPTYGNVISQQGAMKMIKERSGI